VTRIHRNGLIWFLSNAAVLALVGCTCKLSEPLVILGVSIVDQGKFPLDLQNRISEICHASIIDAAALSNLQLWKIKPENDATCRNALGTASPGVTVATDNLLLLYGNWRGFENSDGIPNAKREATAIGEVQFASPSLRFASITGRSLSAVWDETRAPVNLPPLPDSTQLYIPLPGGSSYSVVVDNVRVESLSRYTIHFHGNRPLESGYLTSADGRYAGSWRIDGWGFSVNQLTDGAYVLEGTSLDLPNARGDTSANAGLREAKMPNRGGQSVPSADIPSPAEGARVRTADHVGSSYRPCTNPGRTLVSDETPEVWVLVGYAFDPDNPNSIHARDGREISWDGDVNALIEQSAAEIGPSVNQGVNLRICYLSHAERVPVHLSKLRKQHDATDNRSVSNLVTERGLASAAFASDLLHNPERSEQSLTDFFGQSRVKSGADFALLIIGGDELGDLDGFASGVRADSDSAGAMVQRLRAVPARAAFHELGHLLGARHERESYQIVGCLRAAANTTFVPDDECRLDIADRATYGYPEVYNRPNRAFVRGSFATLMSSGSQNRTPYWSSPDPDANRSRKLSNDYEDNARVIVSFASQLAHPIPSVASAPVKLPPSQPQSAGGYSISVTENCELSDTCRAVRPTGLVQFFYFPSDVWSLENPDKDSKVLAKAVESFASWMSRQNVQTLFIDGYADTVDSYSYNLALSINRAEAVAAALRRQKPGILTMCKGHSFFGADEPTAMGISEARNRRVEVRLDELCSFDNPIICQKQYRACEVPMAKLPPKSGTRDAKRPKVSWLNAARNADELNFYA
jgi:outer membrane protein OmpA-like peptidoglycan-associated protein